MTQHNFLNRVHEEMEQLSQRRWRIFKKMPMGNVAESNDRMGCYGSGQHQIPDGWSINEIERETKSQEMEEFHWQMPSFPRVIDIQEREIIVAIVCLKNFWWMRRCQMQPGMQPGMLARLWDALWQADCLFVSGSRGADGPSSTATHLIWQRCLSSTFSIEVSNSRRKGKKYRQFQLNLVGFPPPSPYIFFIVVYQGNVTEWRAHLHIGALEEVDSERGRGWWWEIGVFQKDDEPHLHIRDSGAMEYVSNWLGNANRRIHLHIWTKEGGYQLGDFFFLFPWNETKWRVGG